MEKAESCTSELPTSKPWQSYHTVYTTAKAGMDGVDKEKVQRIVYEMSKGSKYFENEERKDAFIRQKIDHMRARCANLSAAEISHYQKVADKRVVELEATRDLSRFWLHVDMDAFYAAVETLSNPSLKGKPMAVGSLSMISTANYKARKYGVRAAMPGFIARKLCPELIFVPVDFEKYNHYSSLTREVFRRYDPNFIAASLDEAYLDITEACRERGLSTDEVAEELRRSVFEETGLTCSAGVAPNRLLAKVCSDINKPNGQFILPNDRMAIMTFISSLPIRKIGGIGKVTEHILRDVFGISTCEEMLEKGGFLCALFSHSSADFFLSVALGLGRTDAPEARLRKSMSNERTFSATKDETFLYGKLAELAEMLATDLQKEGLHGRTLTLKLKTASFEVRTRAVTLQRYICSSEDILCQARKLLKAELPLSVRLIGLRVSQFSEEKGSPSDPSQKSITNFIIFGNASGNNTCGTDNLGLREKASSSADNHGDDVDSEPNTDYVQKDEFDSDQLSDFSLSIYSKSESATYMDHCPDNNVQTEGVSKSNESSVQLVERQEPGEATRSDFRCDGEPSSSLQDELQWIDGYKCCICGIELPPDFVDERQEHSDFHLAERMQKECSDQLVTNQWVKQRPWDKRQTVGQSSHKKRKSTAAEQGKFLSIDNFFVKENKNI